MQPPPPVPSSAGAKPVQRLFAFLKQHELVGATVGIAFSGGADSTALAIAAAEAAKAGRLRSRLFHIQHGMRPDDAADLRVALTTAQALALPLSVRRLSADRVTMHTGCGPEEAYRRERYRALALLARETGCVAVLIGHHETDQAETVLAHLLRGSGLDGLRGMRPDATLTIPWWDEAEETTALRVVRPFLDLEQAALRALVAERGLPVVEDPTNEALERTRNRIRHRILPEMRAVNPRVDAALARLARLAAEREVERDPRSLAASDGALPCRELAGLPGETARRMVRDWLRASGLPDVSLNRVEAVLALAGGPGGRIVEVGGGAAVTRDGDCLVVKRTKESGCRA